MNSLYKMIFLLTFPGLVHFTNNCMDASVIKLDEGSTSDSEGKRKELLNWGETFIEKLKQASDNDSITALVTSGRKMLSSQNISFSDAHSLRDYFAKSRSAEFENILLNWSFLPFIKWPKQYAYDALIGYLFYPVQFECMYEVREVLELRSSLQFLMANSCYFGNILACCQCAKIMAVYDLEEDDDYTVLQFVEKYLGSKTKKLVQPLLTRLLQHTPKKKPEKRDIDYGYDNEEAGPQELVLANEIAQEPPIKKTKDANSITALWNQDGLDRELPAHFSALLCKFLGESLASNGWLAKCAQKEEPFCTLEKALILAKSNCGSDKQDAMAQLQLLYEKKEKFSKGLGALGLAALKDERVEKIRLYREAGECDIPKGYANAALHVGKNDNDERARLLLKAAQGGILECYEEIGERYIKLSVKEGNDEAACIERAKQAYESMGNAGDDQGFLALGHFFCKKGAYEEAKKWYAKACNRQAFLASARLSTGDEREELKAKALSILSQRLRELKTLADVTV